MGEVQGSSEGLDNDLRYDDGEALHWSELVETEVHEEVQRRIRDRFVAGPFPFTQFCTAACLPGKALALWQLVHYRIRVTRSKEVTLPAGLLEQIGIGHPSMKARNLSVLEQAGLIRVDRAPGRSARISLIARGEDL